jgi:uncharacterized membrane protein YvbJ
MGTMTCTKCKNAIRGGDIYCSQCGEPVAATQQPVTISKANAQMIARQQSVEEGKMIWLGLGIVVLISVVYGLLSMLFA